MAPRLNHKKSRKGCARCKARKVKCDEVRPICGACQKHELLCEWPNVMPRARKGQTSPSPATDAEGEGSSTKRATGPTSPYERGSVTSFEPEQRQLLELHLLHYYLTIDATNLPLWKDPPQLKAIWTIDAINHALRHPFLLYTIYAITALHATIGEVDYSQSQPQAWFRWGDSHFSQYAQAATGSLTSEDYANAHRYYLNLATRSLREELPSLGPSNADAIVLASILLAIIAQNLIPQMDQPYEPPTQWIALSNSIHSVIQVARPFLSDTPIIESIINTDPIMRDHATGFAPANLAPFQAILDFAPLSPTDLQIYTKAFSYCGGIYALIQQFKSQNSFQSTAIATSTAISTDPIAPFHIKRRITSFPPMLPARFSALLSSHQPQALVVIACLMSMAKVVEEHWWIPGEAERHVNGVGALLRSECGQEWGWAMGWAEEVLVEMGEIRRGWEEAERRRKIGEGLAGKLKGKGRSQQLGKDESPRLERWRSH